MAAILGFREIADAERDGYTFLSGWRKQPTQTTGAGIWFDLSMSPGNPRPNNYIGPAGVFTPMSQSNDGGIPHGGNVSTAVKQLLNASVVSAAATSAPSFFQLVDIIGFIPVSTVTLTTAQTILGSQTYPRYADGKGVQAFIVPVVVMGAGTPTLQLNYTNPASTAGRLTPVAPSLPIANTAAPVGQILYSGTGVGKYGPFMPLQSGDNGILSIQTIQQSATMTSGVYCIVLCKPVGLPLPLTTLGVPGERDYFNQLPSMPIVPDGACLSWLQLAGAATPVNTPYNFTIQSVWKV